MLIFISILEEGECTQREVWEREGTLVFLSRVDNRGGAHLCFHLSLPTNLGSGFYYSGFADETPDVLRH